MSVVPYQTIPFQLTQPPKPKLGKLPQANDPKAMQTVLDTVKQYAKDVNTYLESQQRMMASTVYPDIQNSLGQVSLTGPDASLPSAGVAGRFYFATDTLKLYRDTGSTWHYVVLT